MKFEAVHLSGYASAATLKFEEPNQNSTEVDQSIPYRKSLKCHFLHLVGRIEVCGVVKDLHSLIEFPYFIIWGE